jgi:hypothetical protein
MMIQKTNLDLGAPILEESILDPAKIDITDNKLVIQRGCMEIHFGVIRSHIPGEVQVFVTEHFIIITREREFTVVPKDWKHPQTFVVWDNSAREYSRSYGVYGELFGQRLHLSDGGLCLIDRGEPVLVV